MDITYTPKWRRGSFSGIKRVEDEIVRRLNKLRRARGQAPLQIDERLRTAARQHSLEMVRLKYTSHYSPVAAHKTPWRRACLAGFFDPQVTENLAVKTGAHPAQSLMQGWINSPGHYKNMIHPGHTRIGVGVTQIKMGSEMVYYGTQVFGRAPLDFRKLKIMTTRRNVFNVSAQLAFGRSVYVKAYKGLLMNDVGRLPVTNGAATFSHDLDMPLQPTSFHFGVNFTKNYSGISCASISVDAQGKMRKHLPGMGGPCKAITGFAVTGRVVSRKVRLLTGEMIVNAASATSARFYVNNNGSMPPPLQRGQWKPFTVLLPQSRTVTFAMVVNGYIRKYLKLDLQNADPFTCP